MTLKRVSIPSPNYSSRGGAQVRLVVLHTAEGARTYQDLGHFFQGDVGVSSHVGIDDTPNTVGAYVRYSDKAWTAADFNPVAVQAELCAFAAWTPAEWDKHENMLANTAAWIREECARFGLPITLLNASQAQGAGRGVCDHNALGARGGGHWDVGSGFPMSRVLDMARGGDAGSPPDSPPPPTTSSGAPAYPGYPLVDFTDDPAARTWQERMLERGWVIDVDGLYGPDSAHVCLAFQVEKNLDADGIVGPVTWEATWASPVT